MFTHGQLYVGMSRVGDPSNLRVLIHNAAIPGQPGSWTDNPVYQEIFQQD